MSLEDKRVKCLIGDWSEEIYIRGRISLYTVDTDSLIYKYYLTKDIHYLNELNEYLQLLEEDRDYMIKYNITFLREWYESNFYIDYSQKCLLRFIKSTYEDLNILPKYINTQLLQKRDRKVYKYIVNSLMNSVKIDLLKIERMLNQ